ncbi:sulfurtransferase [Lutibacter sp.]|uniref:sulfurtransferase n=1 Tax=Lutibacter sp. TaxID=1925666 RepID=UPI00356B5E6D
MSKTISPIIEVEELIKIHQLENLVIVDASNETSYKEKHLKGALFVNLNTQLSNIKEDVSVGGRHPLPTIKQFSKTLKTLGINEKSQIVIYDDKNGANSAARFWWMLRAIGHDKVQVLNGGIQEAERKGFPINSELVEAKKTASYNFVDYKLPQATIFEVENCSQDKNYIVVDVREEERYLGIKEPLDLVAGHIPGAVNIPFSTNLDLNGLFKTSKELKNKYQTVFQNIESDHIIVHCGSGVTACHTLLAIAYAGLDIPKLYVGSWSEWSRNNKKIATINTNF